MKKISAYIIIAMSMSGCFSKDGPNCHINITFHNKTAKSVWISTSTTYPDSIAGMNKPTSSPLNRFEASSSHGIPCPNNGKPVCWEDIYFYYLNKGHRIDTLMFYVYDEEVALKEDWKDVKKDYMVLQRYDLSLEDMRSFNWTLSFPPDERMKKIKMLPRYGSE